MKKARVGICPYVCSDEGDKCGVKIKAGVRGILPRYCPKHTLLRINKRRKEKEEKVKQEIAETEALWPLTVTTGDIQHTYSPEKVEKMVNDVLAGKKTLFWGDAKSKKATRIMDRSGEQKND